MRKIGVFKGTFDPISEVELEEALHWLRNEHLNYVIFEINDEGSLSTLERKKLLKKVIKPYRKLKVDFCIKPSDEVLYLNASNTNEEDIRHGLYYLAARGIKKELILQGYYFVQAIEYHCKTRRFEHSLAVSDVCVDLAKSHHLDLYIAKTMGLLHDITKNKSDEWGKAILDIYEPKITSMSPKVWHSETAVFFLKKEMGLTNQKILNAIWHHTLGTGKSDYAKILYIADKCEPTRGYDSSKEINLSKEKLKKGFALCIKESEEYRKKEG